MKDVIKKYKKRRTISNIAILLTSLVFAFSINFLVIKPVNITQNIKTNVLEANTDKQKADLYLKVSSSDIILKTNRNISNITNLTLSFAYNPQNIKIQDTIASGNGLVNIVSNTPGITMMIIDFPTKTSFETNDKIIKINTVKKEEKSEQLNIIKANFTDNEGEIYAPTVSGITF